MLKIQNVVKDYRISKSVNERVLKGVTVDFTPGEITAIFGASGCGKSTLLNILSGLDSKYQGDVYYNDINLKMMNLDSYRKNVVGFIFQNFNLIPHMSVKENVSTVLSMSKISKKERDIRINEALALVGLEDFANRLPKALSGGQKQRVAIARAIAANPEVLIADEPTGSLDRENRDLVLEILEKQAQSGKTVIIVTHDHDIASIADKVVTLDYGVISNIDVKQEIKSEIKESKVFEKHTLGFKNVMKMSFKNLTSRKLRTILVSLGTSIGIAAVLIAFSLGSGTQSEILKTLSTIQDPNDVMVVSTKGAIIKKDIDLIKKELNDDSIKYTASRSYMVSNVENEIPTIVMSTPDEKMKNFTSTSLLYGKPITKNSEVYITLQEANSILGKQNEKGTNEEIQKLIGQTKKLTLAIEPNYNSVGATEVPKALTFDVEFTIAGVLQKTYYGQLYMMSDSFVESHLPISVDDINTQQYVLTTSSKEKAQEISNKFKSNKALEKFTATSLQDIIGGAMQFVFVVSAILAGIAGISLFVSAFMILIVLYTSVVERTKEIGIIRALGFKKMSVRLVFFFEAVFIILFANILGLGLAGIVSVLINSVANPSLGFNPSLITVEAVLLSLAITLVIGMLSALYPAAKASRVDPADSLRYE